MVAIRGEYDTVTRLLPPDAYYATARHKDLEPKRANITQVTQYTVSAVPSLPELQAELTGLSFSQTVLRFDCRDGNSPSAQTINEVLRNERVSFVTPNFFAVAPKYPHCDPNSEGSAVNLMVLYNSKDGNYQVPRSINDLPLVEAHILFSRIASGLHKYIQQNQPSEISLAWVSGATQSIPSWHAHINVHDQSEPKAIKNVKDIENQRIMKLMTENEAGMQTMEILFNRIRDNEELRHLLLQIEPVINTAGTLEMYPMLSLEQFIREYGVSAGCSLQHLLEESYMEMVRSRNLGPENEEVLRQCFCGAISFWYKNGNPSCRVSVNAAVQMEQDVKPVAGIEEAMGNILVRNGDRATSRGIANFIRNGKYLTEMIADKTCFEPDRFPDVYNALSQI